MGKMNLRGLVVCRPFLQDPVIQALVEAEEQPEQPFVRQEAASLLLAAAEKIGLHGNILCQYFLYLLTEGNTIAAESVERSGQTGSGMTKAMAWDMHLLWPYFHEPASKILGLDFLDAYEPVEPKNYGDIQTLRKVLSAASDPEEAAEGLMRHYAVYGCGKLARFVAFRLSAGGNLVGIADFPHFDWEDLLGYTDQKQRLLANTVAFVSGQAANNVLLTGARGTGKSTAVKALVCRYWRKGLRLVQVQRDQLHGLQSLMEKLGRIRSKKFILFLDDLSFDENEKEYKYLKSAIDGGVTPQPSNVLIYATSNRRHLLKETWRDRSSEQEEVYRNDSANESISLSDRFGLILHYSTPTQDEYLQIIAHELKKAGVVLEPEQLRIEALRWEMGHSGRNGRIAQQFVRWYLGTRQSEDVQG